jgi:predicted GNAT superfamily acetyltransferase
VTVVVRRVETQAEYDECVRIEDEIWGAGFNERVPSTIFRVSQYIGGVTAAAFEADGSRMLGFVFGMTGVTDGMLVHWSDLLAVRPEARDRGIGRRLKLLQRSLVIPLGVTRMMWTFDPLVARNAHLNLNGLGVSIAEYVPDMYGVDTGSALHSAVGTDRFIVTWELSREPSEIRPAGAPPATPPSAPPPSTLVVNPIDPGADEIRVRTDARLPEAYVAIPSDIQEVIERAPDRARAWRENTRQAFLWYLAHGYHVGGFQRADGRAFYRLVRGP